MRILRLEQITTERWLNLFVADYEHNAHNGRWIFASRKQVPHSSHNSDAVVIVPVLRNPGEPPRLVLIREYRVPVADYVLGLPAGLVEGEESLETAIARELLEETGFALSQVKRISPPVFSSCGLTDEAVAMAFVDVVGVPGVAQTLEASEEISIVLADYERVCQLVGDASVKFDAKAWIVLMMIQLLGRIE
jgi:ADP-ribose pyrophosphatase